MKRLFPLLVALLVFFPGWSQTSVKRERKDGWHLLDPASQGYMGISLDKAYELLKGRKSNTVIVAVIDSGIDTAQEDLRDILWRNPKEINGNGIDDDHNGYVDDVYGWNFCGSKEGENLARNSYEITRVYHKWKSEFEGKKEKDIPADKKFLFSQWKKSQEIIDKDYEDAFRQKLGIGNFFSNMEKTSAVICEYLSAKEFVLADVKPLVKNDNKNISVAAQFWVDLFGRGGNDQATNTTYLHEIGSYKSQLDAKLDRKLVAPEDWRGELTHDNYTDINDRFYGNNNLKSGSGNHGTSVAGTIAAIRNNGIGTDGIADNVRIMAVRAMPGGDEHDKDVALAIRYAVDNGARIINMSLGKPVSPYKQFVDDAVKYAASKGVLIVHGSGNDGKDLTRDMFYPSPLFLDGSRADNFLNVGASGDESTGGYAAPFSNYSSQYVDIFAPGMNIYSPVTNNGYRSADGTSLASPVSAGVAALLKSYFPNLSPSAIIDILTHAGTPITSEVICPGTDDKKVKFSSLSSSGRIVNAYEAVKLAIAREGKN